ncbi:MAG: hypothetical protein ABW019_18015 [Chitinophagaceae bacterium]
MVSKPLLKTLPGIKKLSFVILLLLVLALVLIAIWVWYDRKLTSLDRRQQAFPVPSQTQ